MAKPVITLAAALSALFPKSEKVISEKISQDEFNVFGAEVQEVQNRLDAQQEGNEAVANDLANTKTTLTETEGKLTAAQSALETANSNLKAAQDKATGLQAKADQWDAYKASLNAIHPEDDSTNPKGKNKVEGLSAKDQAHLDEKARLKAKYPALMADIDVPVQE